MIDSAALLEKMTIADKRRLFAAIAKDLAATNGSTVFADRDDESLVEMFFPYGKAEIVSPDEHSPYLDEIRERAKTAHQSISIEEFLNRVDQADAVAERP